MTTASLSAAAQIAMPGGGFTIAASDPSIMRAKIALSPAKPLVSLVSGSHRALDGRHASRLALALQATHVHKRGRVVGTEWPITQS